MRKLTVLLSVMLLVPAISQAKTLEDLLVEKGVITKGEASAATGGGAKVYWNGGTRVDFPDQGFTTQINTLIQTRYSFTDLDEDQGAENSSSFDVNNARIIMSGNAMHNEFHYMLAPDFVNNTTDGEATPRLLDAVIGWRACDWLDVQMGQFKTGISRQFNTNDWEQQFADESFVSQQFNLDRQQGANAMTNWMDGALWLGAGVFNGESDGEGINRSGVDTEHTAIVTARYNSGSINPWVEGDVDWTDETAFSLGAAAAFSAGETALGDDQGDLEKNTFSIDATVKSQGWSFAAEYYFSTQDLSESESENIEPTGFYAQVGYFIDPKTLELAAQYGYIDCDFNPGDNRPGDSRGVCAGADKINQVQVSVNYYWWKHNLKAQLGWNHLNQDAPGDNSDEDTDSNEWLLQLSAYF